MLRIYCKEKVKRILEIAERNINYGYHKSLKCAPVEIIRTINPINITEAKITMNHIENYEHKIQEKQNSLQNRNSNKVNHDLKFLGNNKLNPI